MRSPESGQVLDMHLDSQSVVAAGEPLLVVGNPPSLKLVVEALSANSVCIEPSMEVRFRRWGGDDWLPGRVRVIADISALHSRWRGLGDAWRVEAEFILRSTWDVQQLLRPRSHSTCRSLPEYGIFHPAAIAGDRVRHTRHAPRNAVNAKQPTRIGTGRRPGGGGTLRCCSTPDGRRLPFTALLQPQDSVRDCSRCSLSSLALSPAGD